MTSKTKATHDVQWISLFAEAASSGNVKSQVRIANAILYVRKSNQC